MLNTNRFGRRLPIPSTRQIRHELLMFGARADERLKAIERQKNEAGTAGLPPDPVTETSPQPLP